MVSMTGRGLVGGHAGVDSRRIDIGDELRLIVSYFSLPPSTSSTCGLQTMRRSNCPRSRRARRSPPRRAPHRTRFDELEGLSPRWRSTHPGWTRFLAHSGQQTDVPGLTFGESSQDRDRGPYGAWDPPDALRPGERTRACRDGEPQPSDRLLPDLYGA